MTPPPEKEGGCDEYQRKKRRDKEAIPSVEIFPAAGGSTDEVKHAKKIKSQGKR